METITDHTKILSVIGENIMVLNANNIHDVMATPEKYKGYCFILEVDKRNFRTKYNITVLNMVKVYRFYGWKFIVVNSDDMDSGLRPYTYYPKTEEAVE